MSDRIIRRGNYAIRRPQASQYRPNRLMLALAVIGEIVGGVVVLLLLFGAIAYGGPVIAEWLGMGS